VVTAEAATAEVAGRTRGRQPPYGQYIHLYNYLVTELFCSFGSRQALDRTSSSTRLTAGPGPAPTPPAPQAPKPPSSNAPPPPLPSAVAPSQQDLVGRAGRGEGGPTSRLRGHAPSTTPQRRPHPHPPRRSRRRLRRLGGPQTLPPVA
jgi:hypothetical protein